MSKKRNRSKLNKAENSSQYRKISININYPIYWDEGMNIKKTGLFPSQYRMYRTWKYNRKTQYKPKNRNHD